MIHQNQMIGKRIEKNNPTIALNILYTNEKEIFPAYISKHISTYEKQLILLMIMYIYTSCIMSCRTA